ncbi:amino acid permease [Corynebacterium tapiri]|uniref:Amino acid permease n=1 Tax=Corynebacterium tapiri TaxID=1448266 RepID=A0A5C4U335_9CORY|nr:amino acid permease [Corynebacterium tapiri]TNL97317.1 amino acid permease [Corynebacterium tapiri]
MTGTTPAVSVFARKPISRVIEDTEEDGGLRRSMGVVHLTALSVGASLGTGIFVVLGEAAPLAGPALVLSFVLAALTAGFSALSYAEMASRVPVSGSSYSYAYATVGEIVAWVCGWCLMLEYAVSVAAVAVGWGQYINELLTGMFNVALPDVLNAGPGSGGLINLPAAVVVILATLVLLTGGKESAVVNTVMVGLKIAVLAFFCVVAFTAFKAGNFAPFAPLGAVGVTVAASQVFFSYVGFDAASTAANEAKNPQRDLPRAIIWSLGIVTAVYCLVAVAALGALNWTQLGESEASLARVMKEATQGNWAALILSAGAVIAISSVVLSVMYGQTRILFTMSRDRLIPPIFGRVNPKTNVPSANIIIVGAFVAILAALIPLGELADATSIGALVAFTIVNVSVIVLRRKAPEGVNEGFRTPLFPLVPMLGIAFCALLMLGLGPETWLTFIIWLAVGLAVYFGYSRKHSALRS